jgi:hypothetical protein
VYHNRFASTAGWIRESVPFAVKAADGTKTIVRDGLASALDLPADDDAFVRFRDDRSGLEYLRSARELAERGLFVQLDAYRCLVYGGFRVVRDGADATTWSALAAHLAGAGVPSLDDALADLRLAPVHAAVQRLVETDAFDEVELDRLRTAVFAAAGLEGPVGRPAQSRVRPARPLDPPAMAVVRLRPLDRASFDRLRLQVPLRATGLDDREIELVRVALGLTRPSESAPDGAIARAWLEDPAVRAFLGIHEWENVEWFGKDAFEMLLELVERVGPGDPRTWRAAAKRLRGAAESSGYRVDRFLAALEEEDQDAGPRRRSRRRSPSSPRS